MDLTVVDKRYREAREKYAELGIDTEKALEELQKFQLSLHCWQGDDVQGFEWQEISFEGSGLQVTGHYPGRARNAAEPPPGPGKSPVPDPRTPPGQPPFHLRRIQRAGRAQRI